VIRFLWAEGVPGGQIHQCMCVQYGDKALSHTVAYEWTEVFKNGRTSVIDTERLGRTTTTTENEERGRDLILQNR
jgi:hypothetical protein